MCTVQEVFLQQKGQKKTFWDPNCCKIVNILWQIWTFSSQIYAFFWHDGQLCTFWYSFRKIRKFMKKQMFFLREASLSISMFGQIHQNVDSPEFRQFGKSRSVFLGTMTNFEASSWAIFENGSVWESPKRLRNAQFQKNSTKCRCCGFPNLHPYNGPRIRVLYQK